MEIEILRIGHRLPRDERISTHVALVARAFGAGSVVYSGQHDAGLEESVKRICENWGGKTPDGNSFSIRYEKSVVSHIKKRKKDGLVIIHLTMYGIPLEQKVPEIKKNSKLMIIVGSEQVPGEIYQIADHNISVTNQPHSEVAALAITLDRIMQGKELTGLDFGGKVSIEPKERGKSVISSSK